jgi:putative nucleotidyltransferase with HDIG domain
MSNKAVSLQYPVSGQQLGIVLTYRYILVYILITMPEELLTGKTAAREIKSKLGILNALTTFVVFTLLAVIIRSLYEPVAEYLDFLPDLSVAVIILIVAVLTLVSVSFSRVFSKQVVASIESYSRNLDSVLNITKEIREEIYGDVLLEKIMDHSLSITDSEAGSILLIEGDELVFRIVRGSKASELMGMTVPTDKGVGGWVMKNQTSLFIHDVSKDERFDSHIDETTGFRTKSILAVPMKTKGRTVGVIELLNKMSGKYTRRDIEMVSYLADQAAISIERAKFYDDQRNYEIHLTNIMIDSIDRFVPELRGHSQRVARYAGIIAKAIKMPEERARRLYFACLMHDIGFMRLPHNKHADKAIFSKHPAIGHDMLSPVNFYKDIAPFILHHHERYDGNGYPDGLQGDKIPLESRIVAIAEAFDVMVSDQSYVNPPLDFDSAINELKENSGTQFDSMLVKHFISNVTKAAVE